MPKLKIKESQWFENLCQEEQDKVLIHMYEEDIEDYRSEKDLKEIEEATQDWHIIYADGYKELGEYYLDEGLLEIRKDLHFYFDAERFAEEQLQGCEEYLIEDIPGLSQNVFVST